MSPQSAQDTAAAMREEAARRSRQRRLLAGTIGLLALVVVVVAIAVGVSRQDPPSAASPSPSASGASGAASPSASPGAAATVGTAFVTTITRLPASVFDAAGAPARGAGPITALADGRTLTQDGKPRVVYVGAEFCPFCAGERWALVAALSRFGTFTGLTPTTSADNDGKIPTVSFVGSTYRSDVVAFTPYEVADRANQPLQTLPADIQALVEKYDAPPYTSRKGSIPWTWFGPWQTVGSSVPLDGFTGGGTTAVVRHDEVAAALAAGSDGLGKSTLEAANVISAQICALTQGKPADVCTSPAVTAAAAVLPR